MAAILHKEPAPLDAPAPLAGIVKRCLAKPPGERFQSMAELKAALDQIASLLAVGAARPPAHQQPSIAVLPFANMSDDREQEYFSDGLAEEIINALTQVKGLKVIARTSAFAFKGKNEDIRRIAETLGVSNVLEGSVRRAGSRLRITAQLIHAADGTHLWSQRYDREMADVFAIQDEISKAITEALEVRLAPRARAMDVEAYQNFLRARHHLARFTPADMTKAKECLERVLAIDPNYAPAYAWLAIYYNTLAMLGMGPAGDMTSLAKEAAGKALALDPANTDVHGTLAIIAGVFEYDWKAAEVHHRKAMATEPVPAGARFCYAGYFLRPMGRHEEAIEQSRLALEADPLSMVFHMGMVFSLSQARRYQETIQHARRALDIDANFYPILRALGLAQLREGLVPEAIASMKRAVELAPWDSLGPWLLAVAYHQAGDREHEHELAGKLRGAHGRTIGASFYYAAAGEVDALFEALEEAYQRRDGLLIALKYQPLFDLYRADPRFQGLLRRMNLA